MSTSVTAREKYGGSRRSRPNGCVAKYEKRNPEKNVQSSKTRGLPRNGQYRPQASAMIRPTPITCGNRLMALAIIGPPKKRRYCTSHTHIKRNMAGLAGMRRDYILGVFQIGASETKTRRNGLGELAHVQKHHRMCARFVFFCV